MPGKRLASSATPTSDWLITAVGPPPWATRILCDMLVPPRKRPAGPAARRLREALGADSGGRKAPADGGGSRCGEKPGDTVTRDATAPASATNRAGFRGTLSTTTACSMSV